MILAGSLIGLLLHNLVKVFSLRKLWLLKLERRNNPKSPKLEVRESRFNSAPNFSAHIHIFYFRGGVKIPYKDY